MKTRIYRCHQIFAFVLIVAAFASCKKFVTLDDPEGQLTLDNVFSENGSATAAVLGLYTSYLDYTMPVMCETGGLAADELSTSSTMLTPYLTNEILPSTSVPGATWAQEYAHIRACNIAIEGLTKSTSINSSVKAQLLGEVKFHRAFGFFNLLNFYGGVPLTLSADPLANASLPRATTEEVWSQIFSDLNDAKEMASAEYPSAERVRVNKTVVSALLARAYLYHNDWEKAEVAASEVIDAGEYSLEDPANAFIPGSNETILQIYIEQGVNPIVFDFLPPAPGIPPVVYLSDELAAAFEPGDLREGSWVGSDGDLRFVQKYKNNDFSSTEYCVLFRLAEMFLIRAEARAQQNNISGTNSAQTDINAVRLRSNLSQISINDLAAALMAIEQERRVELFGEYPHRWFDLKRMKGFVDPSKTRADEVLSVIKGATWQTTDKLFPMTSDDRRLNPNLVQNDGYPQE